jgi:hypothetical protein
MKTFMEPKMSVHAFFVEDVITTSSLGGGNANEGAESGGDDDI